MKEASVMISMNCNSNQYACLAIFFIIIPVLFFILYNYTTQVFAVFA